MRWFAVWLLLLGVYIAVWLAVFLVVGGALDRGLAVTREDLALLLLIPSVQVAALAVLTAVRRGRGWERRR